MLYNLARDSFSFTLPFCKDFTDFEVNLRAGSCLLHCFEVSFKRHLKVLTVEKLVKIEHNSFIKAKRSKSSLIFEIL